MRKSPFQAGIDSGRHSDRAVPPLMMVSRSDDYKSGFIVGFVAYHFTDAAAGAAQALDLARAYHVNCVQVMKDLKLVGLKGVQETFERLASGL